MWFLRQMRRWNWLTEETNIATVARSIYRPDLFSLAARTEDLFLPTGSVRDIAISEAFTAGPASELGMLDF
jgi:hypothetical protein